MRRGKEEGKGGGEGGEVSPGQDSRELVVRKTFRRVDGAIPA